MGFIFNTVKSTVKLCIKLVLYFVVFATIIVLIPNLPPYTKFTNIELPPPAQTIGVLAPNEALNNAAQRYKGKLIGPEAFQVFNGELYTSLATGEIVKISPGGHVTFVTKLGMPCSGLSKEHICGRPLDFKIDEKSKTLYVADAYYGIWKVDLNTDKKHLLVSPQVEIEKRQPKLFNSIALAENGDFYWTDSSSDLQLRDGALATLLDPSGRLFYYNALKNESKVLADELWFPNGVALSPNKEFLVIAESCGYRLLKHYIAGPNKGKTESFVDLPGVPDNIRVLPDGSGVLVGLYIVFDDEHPMLLRSMASTPHLRKFLARLQRLIEIPFEYINSVYPHVIFEDIVYFIGNFKSIKGFIPPMSGLVQVDWNGNIVAAYYNTDSSLGHTSDAIIYNNELHTGSPHQDFIGVLPAPTLLKKAFETDKSKPVEQARLKVEQKPAAAPKQVPTTKPPPPKTTTPPPPRTTPPPPPKTTPSPPPKTTPPPPPKTTPPPPPKTTPPPPSKTTPPPKTTTPPPPKTTTPPPPKTTPPAPPKTTTPPPPKTTTPPPPKTTTPKVTTSQTKPADSKAPSQAKEQPKPTPNPPQGKSKEEIPIKEEIPSDTIRPSKETLKVIKKGGVPTEIPAPKL